MSWKRNFSFTEKFFFVLLSGVFSYCLYLYLHDRVFPPLTPEQESRKIIVQVEGEIYKPGRYPLKAGSTYFELFQIVEVKNTADLSKINLHEPLNDGDLIQVAQLVGGQKVATKTSTKRSCTIVAIKGKVDLGRQGQKTKVEAGSELIERDEIMTEADGQAELELNDLSVIKLGKKSNMSITYLKYNDISLEEKTFFYFGVGYFFGDVNYVGEKSQFLFETPHATLTIKGTEFSVAVNAQATRVHVYRGNVYVKPLNATTGINVLKDQMTTIKTGDVQILAEALQEQIKPAQQFGGLKRPKQEVKAMNFLLIGIPFPIIFVQLSKTSKRLIFIRIPNETVVSDLVQGFDHIELSIVYGGPQFMVSIVEQLIKVPIQFYIVQRRDDVVKTIDLLKGVTLDIESEMAEFLKIHSGKQKLEGKEVVRFCSPTAPGGAKKSWERQIQVIEAILQQLSDQSVNLGTAVIKNMLEGVESNFSAEILLDLLKLMKEENWRRNTSTLPGFNVTKGGKPSWQVDPKQVESMMGQ